jgi:hypothetical protein
LIGTSRKRTLKANLDAAGVVRVAKFAKSLEIDSPARVNVSPIANRCAAARTAVSHGMAFATFADPECASLAAIGWARGVAASTSL